MSFSTLSGEFIPLAQPDNLISPVKQKLQIDSDKPVISIYELCTHNLRDSGYLSFYFHLLKEQEGQRTQYCKIGFAILENKISEKDFKFDFKYNKEIDILTLVGYRVYPRGQDQTPPYIADFHNFISTSRITIAQEDIYMISLFINDLENNQDGTCQASIPYQEIQVKHGRKDQLNLSESRFIQPLLNELEFIVDPKTILAFQSDYLDGHFQLNWTEYPVPVFIH